MTVIMGFIYNFRISKHQSTKTLNIEKSFTWITLYMKIITHAKKFRLTSVVSLFKGEKQHFVTKFCFIWGVVYTRYHMLWTFQSLNVSDHTGFIEYLHLT